MTTLVGPAAQAENDAQAASTSTVGSRRTVPSIFIGGRQVHASDDYRARFDEWTIMRDCFAGQRTIKGAGETYLPRPSNVDVKDYAAYKSRAYFYNATRRTHEGLVGAVMRKNPEVVLPTGLRMDLKSVTLDGMSFREFVGYIVSEMLLTSRFGILTDIPKSTPAGTAPSPYFSGYTAESIYAIRHKLYRGRKIRDRIVLIEQEALEDDYGITTQQIYRVLRLDPVDPKDPEGRLRYSQEIVRPAVGNSGTETREAIQVLIQGRELDYIPFVVINPKHLLSASQQPVLLPLAEINLSHYESTALLEHGRFYAGMPTYYIAGDGASNKDDPLAEGLGTAQPMTVGPSNLWMLEKDDKCGLLEFTGHGLTFLENAVDSKQLQMHSLGGKLIPTQRKAAALSSEAYGLMESGDEATLLDIAIQIDAALMASLDYANDLQNNPPANNTLVQLNKEFIRSELTAREVRAIQTLYERRLIPLDVLYYTLRQIGIIPMEYSLEDFKRLLSQPAQLYNDPETQPIAGGPTYDPVLQAQKAAQNAARAAAQAGKTPPNGA